MSGLWTMGSRGAERHSVNHCVPVPCSPFTRNDEQLKELLKEETDAKEIFLHLSARDVDAARSDATKHDDAG